MLERIVPNFKEELYKIEKIGNAGFLLGFALRYRTMPQEVINRFPQAWLDEYEENHYMFKDPVVIRAVTQTGSFRWSEIGQTDPHHIMSAARKYGLNYGALMVVAPGGVISFFSVARKDRELTDAEMSFLMAKLETWANLHHVSKISITDKEIDALKAVVRAPDQAAAAANLNISVSALKARLKEAQRKLGAETTVGAVEIAAKNHLI